MGTPGGLEPVDDLSDVRERMSADEKTPPGQPSKWSGPNPWTKAPKDVNFELGYKDDAHRFADYAVNIAVECFEPGVDPRDRSDRIRLAQMWATLSLQFKLDELNETVKHDLAAAVESVKSLDGSLQNVIELRRRRDAA